MPETGPTPQPSRMLRIGFQRTVDRRRASPAPIMAPTSAWFIEVKKPNATETRITVDWASWEAVAIRGSSSTRSNATRCSRGRPQVSTPRARPRPPTRPARKSPKRPVMIRDPEAFDTSFAPMANEAAAPTPTRPRTAARPRAPRVERAGPERSAARTNRNPRANAANGAVAQRRTREPIVVQWMGRPAANPAPTVEKTRIWMVDVGIVTKL